MTPEMVFCIVWGLIALSGIGAAISIAGYNIAKEIAALREAIQNDKADQGPDGGLNF